MQHLGRMKGRGLDKKECGYPDKGREIARLIPFNELKNAYTSMKNGNPVYK